jgi:hypothetical protein
MNTITHADWNVRGETRMTDAQRRMLNAVEARELLRYERDTGRLIWKRHMTPRARMEKEAGVIQSGRYRRIGIYGRYYMAHRLAWLIETGKWPDKEIDHVNGICYDNRWCNLRPATTQQNNRNTLHANKSGLIGASYHSGTGRFRAQIRTSSGRKFLGWFDTAEQAHAAYRDAARAHHGEFSRC